MQWSGLTMGVGMALAIALGAGAGAAAAATEPSAARDAVGARERRLEPVGAWAFKRIDRAHQALAAERYDEVIETLDEMRPNHKLNAHERALMWQAYAFAYSSQERYAEAAEAFAQCLAADGLDPSATLQMRYNLAQIYVLLERYDAAIREFGEWFAAAPNPSATAYYMYAMAHVQKGDRERALALAREAVRRGGPDAREPWLQLVSALLLERKEYAAAADALEALVARFPKKAYWLQLSAVYSELDRPEKALAVLELAQAQGLLTQANELMSLAQLYLYNQIPYKAADVIERGLARGVIPADARAYQLLADSLLHARERDRALAPLRRAAELSDDGNAYLRLAQVYMEREEWAPASAALGAGVEKGNLRSPGHAYLLLGIASANQKRWAAAEHAFAAAREFDATQGVATHWLQHLTGLRGEQPADEQVATGAPHGDQRRVGDGRPSS